MPEVAVVTDTLRVKSFSSTAAAQSYAADNGLFGRIVDAWGSEPAEVRTRGIAMDVALIHIASMSNLMAALGWALVFSDRPADALAHYGAANALLDALAARMPRVFSAIDQPLADPALVEKQYVRDEIACGLQPGGELQVKVVERGERAVPLG